MAKKYERAPKNGTTSNPDAAHRSERRAVDTLEKQIRQTVNYIQSLAIAVPRVDLIQSYLREHSDMLDLTSKVARLVNGEFGPGGEVSLESYRSPEEDDEQIVFFVRRHGPETYRRIESIWDQYTDDLANASGWLHVTSDFRRRPA